MSHKIRRIASSFVLGGLALALGGCESIRQSMGLRTDSAEAPDAEEVDKALNIDTPLDVRSAKPAPFFKNSRLSGGLSDQAREIEADMGIR